jgi:hypothetical protein
MISSTRADLMQYREVAFSVLEKLRKENQDDITIIPIGMEEALQTGNREYPVGLSKKWVEEADWVVLIVGWHYGTITEEEGAEGLSVTEWEYRHADEKRKPIFVFMPGDVRTANEYRPSTGERENLSGFLQLQEPDAATKIKQFRVELGKKVACYFRNIEVFELELERTLRKKIRDQPPGIREGTGLANLILACEPTIRRCTSSFNMLKQFKLIHDALHWMRQEVIRKMREEVMPKWAEACDLTEAQKSRLIRLNAYAVNSMVKISGYIAAIYGIDHELADAGNLRPLVAQINSELPFFDSVINDDETVTYSSREHVVWRLDAFSMAIQKAFTEADKVMQNQNRIFDRFKGELHQELDAKSSKYQLQAEEVSTLNAEIDKVTKNSDRLDRVLKEHGNWQRIHDEIENLREFRETQIYPRKLKSFFAGTRNTLERCIVDSLNNESADEESPPVLRDLLEKLDGTVKAWSAWDNEQQFQHVCSAFDDSFFRVDQRTLKVVEASSDRAQSFDQLLRKLHAGRSANAPNSN